MKQFIFEVDLKAKVKLNTFNKDMTRKEAEDALKKYGINCIFENGDTTSFYDEKLVEIEKTNEKEV